MSQLTIRGKQVQVRESFRGREWYSLPGLYRKAWKAATAGEYAAVIPFLARVIESWELDGDPADAASYETLDVIGELAVIGDYALLAVSAAAFPPAGAGV